MRIDDTAVSDDPAQLVVLPDVCVSLTVKDYSGLLLSVQSGMKAQRSIRTFVGHAEAHLLMESYQW